jgi:hypothetical protein
MKTYHLALMDLTVFQGDVVSTDGVYFDREAYSDFKHGYTPPGLVYGKEMAQLLSSTSFWSLSSGRQILIVSAPYKFLPTASHVIAQELHRALSLQAFHLNREMPLLVPILKDKAGDSSYAKGGNSVRKDTLDAMVLKMDESLVPDSVVVVVDDIRITGGAEIKTASYVEPLGPHSVWYLHAARLDAAIAEQNPGLEDELNQSLPHSLATILDHYQAGHFQLNTRILRHMLETPVKETFEWFVATAPLPLLREMQAGAFGNGLDYCKNDKRYHNLLTLNDAVARRTSYLHRPEPVLSA